jgi:CMP-N-acetylneuraminic acid synthetase
MIAVVPARGGSKGIKRKNLRFLNGKPLLFYVLQTLKTCELIEDIIVTTDDNEIMRYVNQFGVKIHNRPPELAGDDVTLDPVILSAITWYEEVFEKKVNHVVTVQPTSPLLTKQTLSEAIKYFIASDNDCVISTVDDTHLTRVRLLPGLMLNI